MNRNLRALQARLTIVGVMFFASACVLSSNLREAEAQSVEAAKPEVAVAPAVEPKVKAQPTPAKAVASAKTQNAPAKVSRYVAVDTLNVRTRPSLTAPIVAKLTRGSMFAVAIKGDWAEIAPGQYVMAKHLADRQGGQVRQGRQAMHR